MGACSTLVLHGKTGSHSTQLSTAVVFLVWLLGWFRYGLLFIAVNWVLRVMVMGPLRGGI